VEAVAAHHPDLVVVDVRMPPTFTDEGARAARQIKEAHPETGLLVLSQHIEVTHAVALVSLGGFGYLLKDRVLAVDEFLSAAERVAQGGSALDPKVVASLSRTGWHRGPARRALRPRAGRPRARGQGLCNAAIAKRLFMSERTVEAHVRHILMKLDIPQREESHRRVLAVLAHLKRHRNDYHYRALTA
jgi:DNA-binding NarL/FixJ family response regulator